MNYCLYFSFAYLRQNIRRWSFSPRALFLSLCKVRKRWIRIRAAASHLFNSISYYFTSAVQFRVDEENKSQFIFPLSSGNKAKRPSERADEREYVGVRLSIYLSGDSSMIAFVLHRLFASYIYGILCRIANRKHSF